VATRTVASRRLTCVGTLALVLNCATLAGAQETTPAASVDDLKAPPSPAFVLLGVAPSKVDRPQAVRPLVLSALSAVSSEGFPRNYAVEFAPYWLGTPELSFDDYYNSGIAKALVRHLSASVATTPLNTTGDTGTAVAVGARTLPVPGRAHPKLRALRSRLEQLQEQTIDEEGFFGRRQRLVMLLQEAKGQAVSDTTTELATKPFEDLVDRMIDLDFEIERHQANLASLAEDLTAVASRPPNERPAREAAIKQEQTQASAALAGVRMQRQQLASEMLKTIARTDIANNLAAEKQFETLIARYDQLQKARAAGTAADLKETALAIQALDTQRVGPLLAVATAVAWDVPHDQTTLVALSKVGIWVTPGYRMVRCSGSGIDQACSAAIDLLGVVRYLDDQRDDETGSVWELGGRVILQPQAKLAVSGEWLGRTGDGSPASRIVGVAEYEISDSAFLYASFGRDFAEPGVRRNLVSTIGLTFGFGKKPIIN
jgi:hypothetical protein